MRYRVEHSKIKFVSTRWHVISSICFTLPAKIHLISSVPEAYNVEAFMLFVSYSKDHNCFHWHGIAFRRALFDGTERGYTAISDNLPTMATSVAVYFNQA